MQNQESEIILLGFKVSEHLLSGIKDMKGVKVETQASTLRFQKLEQKLFNEK